MKTWTSTLLNKFKKSCPICRKEIDKDKKWRNTQEEILRLQQKERFGRAKHQFFCRAMSNKKEEIRKLERTVRKLKKQIEVQEKKVLEKDTKEEIPIITIE